MSKTKLFNEAEAARRPNPFHVEGDPDVTIIRGKPRYPIRKPDPVLRGAPWWSRGLYSQTRRNAERRGIPFEISSADYKELAIQTRNRCSVTGIPFEHNSAVNCHRRPFAPSLDRIDSSKGYTYDNCRFVCVIVNLAMNEWGVEPLMRVADALLARRKKAAA